MSVFWILFIIYTMVFVLVFNGLLFILWKVLKAKELSVSQFSSLEAGFSSLSKSVMGGFSIQFFILLFIFIIFDLEILILFSFMFLKSVTLGLIFIIFVLFTLLLEWKMNKLSWVVL